MKPSYALSVALMLAFQTGCPEESTSGSGGAAGHSGTGGEAGGFVCPYEYLGDPEAPIEIEVFTLGADEMDHPLADGGTIDLIEPPQGGRVMFVGVRATNVNPCGVTLGGTLRDNESTAAMLDRRTVNLIPEDGRAGWGRVAEGDVASYANTAACFNTWATQSIDGGSFRMIVEVKDADGKSVSETFQMSGQCTEKTLAQGSVSGPAVYDACLCYCEAGYVLGQACPTDP